MPSAVSSVWISKGRRQGEVIDQMCLILVAEIADIFKVGDVGFGNGEGEAGIVGKSISVRNKRMMRLWYATPRYRPASTGRPRIHKDANITVDIKPHDFYEGDQTLGYEVYPPDRVQRYTRDMPIASCVSKLVSADVGRTTG